MSLLWVFLSDKLTSIILFVSKHIIVGWNRRRFRKQHPHDTTFCPAWVLIILFYEYSIRVMIATWTWMIIFRPEVITLKALHTWYKARMRFDKLYAKLVNTESFQLLHALDISVNFVKAVRNFIASRTYDNHIYRHHQNLTNKKEDDTYLACLKFS